MLAFGNIFFDSEPLVCSKWPNISEELKAVLRLARHFDVRLFLPLATEMELEEHWYRDFLLLSSAVSDSFQKLNRSLRYVDFQVRAPDVPDEALARRQYRAAVERIKEEWGFGTVPLTPRDLGEVFGMAIRRSPPFKEEGAGFQDTVIYMSVIDHLREQGGTAAFISNDAIFKKQRERILQLAEEGGVQLRLYRTVGELEKEFARELGEEIGNAMKQDRNRVTEILKARLPDIADFIFKNIEIPKAHPFVGDLVELERIEVFDVEYVLTHYRNDGEPLNASFHVPIKAHVLLDTSPYAFFRSALTVKAESQSENDLEEQSKVIPHVLEYRIELECTVSAGFDEVQLTSAKIKT
jgi:hypothetical protein